MIPVIFLEKSENGYFKTVKKGQFITLKAVVKKHDLNVLEIEETK